MMTEWIEYTGSDEQIAEMESAQYGVLLSNNPSEIVDVSDMVCLSSYLNEQNVTNYLICNPHPLADMICQQARTGQPVWVRVPYDEGLKPWKQIGHYQNNYQGFRVYETTTPNWNIPNAEYSFTEFKEEVCLRKSQ